ncbi:MAG: ATP-binding protein [Lachnospiraceae bacterium]|nr:ATP-binding protein [Lachnospiraceae bacterium]
MPLSNSQYDSLKREYDSRRLNAFHEVNNHKEELYKKEPEILKIDQSIASLSIKHAERLLEGDETAIVSLKKSLIDLNEKKAALMSNLGVDMSYIEPDFKCKDCKDTGFVNGKRCHCFEQASMNILYNQSNLINALSDENFENFNYDIFSDNPADAVNNQTPYQAIKNAVIKCRSFIDSFDEKHGNLFIFGPTGVGKTFLSNCVAKDLIDRGKSVIYFSAFGLFDVFKENAYNKTSDAQDMYQNIFNCDLLIIDDLGTEISNSYTTSQLFMCINERILRHKSTIISTNLDLEGLRNSYTERTFSRISRNYDFIRLVGKDLRLITRRA